MERGATSGGRLGARPRAWRGLLAALAVLAVAAPLRLVNIGGPFATGDMAEVAAVVSFFYPRGPQSLDPGSPFAVWQLLQNPHGLAPVLIALPWVTLLGALGVQLNEFWWNLPFALLGLLILPAGYRLGEQLGGRRAGFLCAVMLAALPVHASLSRASGGGSHIAIALVAQLWAVSESLRFFEDPTERHMRRASLAIVLAVLTDVLLPALFFMLLAVALFSRSEEAGGFFARLRRGRALLFGGKLIVWPLVALAWPVGLLLAQAAGLVSYGGLLARLFSGSNREPGIRVGEFAQNAGLNAGPLVVVILLVCALLTLPALLRLERHGFLLVWAGMYLAPFVLFSRPYVFDFYIQGITPLVINAALIAAGLMGRPDRWRRLAGGALAAALFVLLLLRSVSMIFGAPLGPLVGTGPAAGAVLPDQGLKAAAWWVRANAPPDALVFADAPYEPYQLAYYLRRPFLAQTDAASSEAVFAMLRESDRRPNYYLVLPGNERLLRAYGGEAPQLAATVLVDGRPALLVFAEGGGGPPEQVDAAEANARFDRDYGGWREMFGLE